MSTQQAPIETQLAALQKLHSDARIRVQQLRHQLADALDREQRLGEQLGQVVIRCERKTPGSESFGERGVGETVFRAALRGLGSFSAAELAAEVGCSKAKARAKIKEYEQSGVVIADGKLGVTPTFKYIKPTDTGNAFKNQQDKPLKLAPELAVVDREADPMKMPDGVIAGTGNTLISAMNGDTKKAVKAAVVDGWTLLEAGSGHFYLSKGYERVRVSKTPQNDSTHAQRVRRETGQ